MVLSLEGLICIRTFGEKIERDARQIVSWSIDLQENDWKSRS
jgi:hypothetical protein